MGAHKTAYFEGRDRVCDLVVGLGDDELAAPLPACPGWTVKDALAHVTGIVDDSLSGNLDGVGTDAWTQAHLDKRAAASIEEIVEEWKALSDQAAAVFDDEGPLTASLIGDFATHEHDLRGGLGNRDARDTDAVDIALEWYARQFTKKVASAGLAPVRVAVGGREWVRDGEPAATLRGSTAFELLRALTGRRTRDEVRTLDWEGDPEPYLDLVSFYGWPEGSLGE